MSKDYEIEVAFTLLHEDANVASLIKAGLGELETFLYIDRQSELVGSDADLLFRDVFVHKSRVVVILYRTGWGEKGYTYVEKEAIRDRKFRDSTEDFIIFVNMTGNEKLPNWVSNRTIWYNYKDYGLQGIIATIKHKINELGGLKRPETLKEIADRKAQEYDFINKRHKFINSEIGVNRANEEFLKLRQLIKENIEKIRNKFIQFDPKESGDNELLMRNNQMTLNVHWYNYVSNTLESQMPAHLDIAIMKRNFDREYYDQNSYYKTYEQSYRFNMFFPDLLGWNKEHAKEFISSNNLAEDIVKKMMENL